MKNIFLTGEKSVGKSTLIQEVLNQLDLSVGGYITERVIKDNTRMFTIKSLYDEAEAYHIANVDINDYSREVFIDSFNIGVVSILEKSLKEKDIIILDELGFFEEDSENFKRKVYELLDSSKLILGTIKDYNSPFLNNIRARNDVLLIEVTKDNRENLLNELINIIKNNFKAAR